MKRIILILAISLMSCRCSPVKETAENTGKINYDLEASNWILRHQKDSLNGVISTYKDSLWKCREDSRIVK